MRSLLFSLALLSILSCDDVEKQTYTGEWDIHFNFQQYSSKGELKLYHDHTGSFSLRGDQTSALIPKIDQFKFEWFLSDHVFGLYRLDNKIEVNYDVISISPSRIQLRYDEVDITLIRK